MSSLDAYKTPSTPRCTSQRSTWYKVLLPIQTPSRSSMTIITSSAPDISTSRDCHHLFTLTFSDQTSVTHPTPEYVLLCNP